MIEVTEEEVREVDTEEEVIEETEATTEVEARDHNNIDPLVILFSTLSKRDRPRVKQPSEFSNSTL